MKLSVLESWLGEAREELRQVRKELLESQQQVADAESRVKSLEALMGDESTAPQSISH